MGVDVSAVMMIGIQFKSVDEAEEFVRVHYKVDDDALDVDDFEDLTGGLVWQTITAYDNRGGVIGVKLNEQSLNESGEGIKEAWRTARELFPDSVQDKIVSHCWAQYS
jgi:hypothetical protein